MNIVTISSKGQITIPKEFRQDISKYCVFEKKDNVIMLKPIKIEILENDIEDELQDFGKLANKSFDFWNNEKDDIYQKFYK